MISITKYEITKQDLLLYKDILPTINLENIVAIDTQASQPHDKTIKKILEEKEEVVKFLKEYIGIEEELESIEEYKNEFITNLFKKLTSDIVYKVKGKGVFYLIEHQSTVDKNMPVRILKYSAEIIDNVKVNDRSIENPIIVPIVIYTGHQKWNVETNFGKTQLLEEKYKKYKIGLKYNLVDINKIAKEKLIKDESKLSKLILIEKCNTSKEIRDSLIGILQNTEDEKMIEWVRDIMFYMLPKNIDEDVKNEIKETIRKMEVKRMDEEWEKRIMQGDAEEREKLEKKFEKKFERKLEKKAKQAEEKGEKIGIKTAIIKMVENMINHNESDDKIILYTNIDKKELKKIKKQLNLQSL